MVGIVMGEGITLSTFQFVKEPCTGCVLLLLKLCFYWNKWVGYISSKVSLLSNLNDLLKPYKYVHTFLH